MKVIEFAKENPKTIVLLHGGGLSWWNYQDVAERFSQKYHVVIPLLDGHAGSDCDFTSIENAAGNLCDYIDKQYGGSVFAIGGLSLGGQILVEMLSLSPCICQYAIIESALIIPMTLTNRLIGPMLRMSYGLIQKRWFARLQFNQLHIKPDLFDAYYTCAITQKNMIAILKSNSAYQLKDSIRQCSAKVIVAVGGKEGRKMKQSARLLHQVLPNSKFLALSGYYHGDLSINHADEYVELFQSLIEE